MIGSIVGDIIGSRFEFKNNRSKKFDLFTGESTFTDDTVSTIATMDWLNTNLKEDFAKYLKRWYKKYPNVGFSTRFVEWVNGKEKGNSFGNGASMRIAPLGHYFIDTSLMMVYSDANANTTHNSDDGAKGAFAIAMAVYYAKQKLPLSEIKNIMNEWFDYDLDISLSKLSKNNTFTTLAKTTVPQAIACFLQSESFEDAIRLAISIGGDSDTIASMTGGIAGAFYPIPKTIRQEALKRLPQEMVDVINKFSKTVKEQHSDENLAKQRFVMG